MDVVCVVLNCPDMYERSGKLIENAFKNYALRTVSGSAVFMCGGLPCNIGEDINLLIEKEQEITVKCIRTNDATKINQGDMVGRLEIYCKNDLIFSGNLYSIVNRKTIF